MLLKNLIKNVPNNIKNLKITGLSLNSNDIKKGFIFFAIRGNKSNGENYINEAIKKGARLIICSNKCKFREKKIYVIKTTRVRDYLSEITSNFYKIKPKNLIAVTGTNGKTSVADFYYQIFNSNNIPVASIGTLGIKSRNTKIKTNLTSPDIITLHKNLEKLKKKKIDNVIIEASSHGLDQKRLDKLNFKAGIFTNFSQDHLDYHKTMKNYFNAKLILFKKLLPKYSNIIADGSSKEFPIFKKIAKKRKLKIIDSSKIDYFKRDIPKNFIDTFQSKNLTMAILAAQLSKLNKLKIKRNINKIKNVDGRLEFIRKFPNNIKIYIDYAHTPDALYEALKSLNNVKKNKISLVFGCGGERDFKKRSSMAKIAKSMCEKIFVTDDNPRNENPKKIRNQIIKHLKNCNYYNIGSRAKAIREAVIKAEPNEIILVAGKGHEIYQDYGHKVLSTSDRQIIKRLKIKKKTINKKEKNYMFNSNILNSVLNNDKFFRVNGIAIDSRDVKKDNIFLTIKGKNRDGNNFINKALKKGAKFVISSKKNKNNRHKIIKVRDTINFLNNFAKIKRSKSHAKILAITGSAGKTSLKNMIYSLLKNFKRSYASPKSFNNHYGVPLSVSNLDFDHEFGVFEVGMSKAGEIDKLSKIIKPHIAVITNIAEAHIENFKNIKGIAKAKGELIDNIESNGTVILNRDDDFFHFLSNKAKQKNIKVISFGKSKNSDIKLISIKKKKGLNLISISANGKKFKLKVNNVNIYNVLASFAVLLKLNINFKNKLSIFKKLKPSEGRGQILKIKRYKKSFNLVDESYNANPLSVKNAINKFVEIDKRKAKKYLLLGDMLELGKKSEKYHSNLSRLINRSDIDKVFIKGEKSLFTYKHLIKNKRGNIFQCNQDIDETFKNLITNDDYLMIKGSNATGLNTISKEMIKGTNVI
ncbi:UDP-N-acetylmuramoyl-L-alanyl-D-glutamate--2,6-diaminopimelate ligase [Candidatus Pelagibacter bacterium]|nr:UDP-N-acetylmuramoyl-L-alanyl-D-glutamate--2,6-diaminopimelate ligase [Candidatus Pelagibacter bacterium]